LISVDLLKRVHTRATDALCKQRIVYHHVPKCGGTSVGRGLRRAYFLSQGTVRPYETELAFDLIPPEGRKVGNVLALREMMLLYLLYSDCRCVSAHVPFSTAAHEQFRDDYVFVTVLRNPVERFLSHYRWLHRPNSHDPTPAPLEEFLDTELARKMGSAFVRYFRGRPEVDRIEPRHIDDSIDNLRKLNLVGFLDELPRFQSGLRKLTGRQISIGKENVGSAHAFDTEVMNGPLADKVASICAPDQEIWDAVQDLRRSEPRTLQDVRGAADNASA